MSRYCSKCGKAKKACICRWIQSLASNVELVILQHPSEQNKPLGTARILQLSLENSQIIIGENFSDNEQLNQLLKESDTSHYLLFPNECSTAFSKIALANPAKKLRVILIDGTWRKAYKIWQLSTNLHCLPSIRLPDDIKGKYTIRKAPTENSVSTVEAGYHLLSMLDSEHDFKPLLTAFENMIQFQIKQMPEGVFDNNYRS